MKNIFAALLLAQNTHAQSQGTASSSRGWNCKGGSCGCGFRDKDLPTFCHSNALFAAPADNEHGAKFYGGVGISTVLGGTGWLGAGCGKCFKVTATSNVDGALGTESTVVLKGVGNAGKYRDKPHFEMYAPGYDHGPETAKNICETNGEETALQVPQACGTWPTVKCTCDAFVSPTLKNGCENFQSLNWDDPVVTYEELSACPAELMDTPPCWTQDGNTWPAKSPATCTAPAAPAPAPSPPTPIPGCPGGSDKACTDLCPTSPLSTYNNCVAICSERCKKEHIDWMTDIIQ